jgi:hypothetical protein
MPGRGSDGLGVDDGAVHDGQEREKFDDFFRREFPRLVALVRKAAPYSLYEAETPRRKRCGTHRNCGISSNSPAGT